ncbi:transglycosylase domain-containing protein [Altererythrobacter rubellus]|uniref:PBP1A family penicillin-binding protein n=1 Tax=Altererythrobacter rubellus TaxID=2173831 RepID=A0A9Y2BBX7_9SPHN|nr:PBP1A family penicillin-binding protein [Altererythrobacter rubellus]WIW96652.1 PBP1A family penicillin-binding protein [Altererythrobacter rubellus]
MKRGSRRAAAERSEPGSRRKLTRKSRGGGGSDSRLRLWAKRIALWGGGLAVLGAVFLAVAVSFAVQTMPSYYQLKATQNDQTILVRARDGTPIVELGPSFGNWMDYDEIPQVMKDAMVAVEDRRFYSHFGVDPIRLTGAVVEGTIGDRSRIGGTSTISQQLARNLFLNNNRSVDRKAREAVLAAALEWKFSKEQILELYLNKVYFGGGAYGIDSASRNFFSHPATELSVAEAAIIAGLVKAPSRYSPTADVDAAVARAQTVLRLMREQGYITPQQASVDVDAVNLKTRLGGNSVRYFTDYVLPQLDLLLPETFEAIEVWTTLDTELQEQATASIRANAPDGAQGALVSLDRDGAILALVGGTDYVESSYNRATAAQRQPGSAWKLFVYLAALEAGWTPDDGVQDAPVEIDGWRPRNSNGRFSGEIDVRTAFAYSVNTVAANLGQDVGSGTIASMARRFGISSPISTYPSMVLGTSDVRLIEMTRAFASISAKGQSVEPYGVLRVTAASGEEIYKHQRGRSRQLVADYVAAGITDLLQTAVSTGTGRAAQIGRPVAGKTGTTSSNKDGWFVGFSSGITTGVWMGRDDAKAVRGLQGGRAPALAFSSFMREAVKGRPVEEFDTEVQLPGWMLEPDEEYLYGDPDDYYFIDEDGNLVDPQRREVDRYGYPLPVEGEQVPGSGERPQLTLPPNEAGQAASDDFLDRATGENLPPPAPPRMPRTIRSSETSRESVN